DCAPRDEPQNQTVRRVEYQGVLDTHTHQIGNGKKTAVIDGFVDVLPECVNVILLSKQALQIGETARIRFLAVKVRNIFMDKLPDFLAACCQLTETLANGLESDAFVGGRLDRRGIAIGYRGKCSDDA